MRERERERARRACVCVCVCVCACVCVVCVCGVCDCVILSAFYLSLIYAIRKAVEFLKAQAEEIGLSCSVVEVVPLKPILLCTWRGRKPDLQSVLLNSHYDVVSLFSKFQILQQLVEY